MAVQTQRVCDESAVGGTFLPLEWYEALARKREGTDGDAAAVVVVEADYNTPKRPSFAAFGAEEMGCNTETHWKQ